MCNTFFKNVEWIQKSCSVNSWICWNLSTLTNLISLRGCFPLDGNANSNHVEHTKPKHWLPGLLQELWSRHISRVIWAFNWIHGQWSYCWKFGGTALPVSTRQAQWPLSQLLNSAYVAKAAIDTLWTSRVALSNRTCYTTGFGLNLA